MVGHLLLNCPHSYSDIVHEARGNNLYQVKICASCFHRISEVSVPCLPSQSHHRTSHDKSYELTAIEAITSYSQSGVG